MPAQFVQDLLFPGNPEDHQRFALEGAGKETGKQMRFGGEMLRTLKILLRSCQVGNSVYPKAADTPAKATVPYRIPTALPMHDFIGIERSKSRGSTALGVRHFKRSAFRRGSFQLRHKISFPFIQWSLNDRQALIRPLHFAKLLFIGIQLQFAHRPFQSLRIRVTRFPGESGGMNQGLLFIPVKHKRGIHKATQQFVAASRTRLGNNRRTAGAQRINAAVNSTDMDLQPVADFLSCHFPARTEKPENR
ncbi:hypothetical protein D1872_235290 [compost metagenome]